MPDRRRKPSRKVVVAIVVTAAIFWALVVLFRIVAMASAGTATTGSFT